MDDEIVEIAEQQADITRMLLHHIHAPVTGTRFVRGVLPAPESAAAVRLVVGPVTAYPPDELIVYEFPLAFDDDTLNAYDVIGMLRTLSTGTHVHSGSRIGTVMGMTLVHVDPAGVEFAAETPEDNALRVLRTLAHHFIEEPPHPVLRGFLFLDRDRLRLYLDPDEVPGVIAADISLSGALTALISALPSLITEEERMVAAPDDPHCARLMDLTYW